MRTLVLSSAFQFLWSGSSLLGKVLVDMPSDMDTHDCEPLAHLQGGWVVEWGAFGHCVEFLLFWAQMINDYLDVAEPLEPSCLSRRIRSKETEAGVQLTNKCVPRQALELSCFSRALGNYPKFRNRKDVVIGATRQYLDLSCASEFAALCA
jgi:hypothetical protein